MQINYNPARITGHPLWPVLQKRVDQIIRAGNDPAKLKKISPLYLNLDITWQCNNRCIGCIDNIPDLMASGKANHMPWEIVDDLIGYAKEKQLIGFIVQGGEPLIYPKINEFLLACAEHNLILRLVTNGIELSRHADAVIAALKIRGASIRVSINTDESHYNYYSRSSGRNYNKAMEGIRKISERGIEVDVGAIVFGQNHLQQGLFYNIDQIRNIVRSASSIGAKRIFLRPARHPKTKIMVNLTEEEHTAIKDLAASEKKASVIIGERFVLDDMIPAKKQNKNWLLCFTGLLRAVVGSDGTLFNCTDHRGNEDAVIGKISQSGDFARIWHSEERVMKQLSFSPNEHCREINCNWYSLNYARERIHDPRTMPPERMYLSILFGLMREDMLQFLDPRIE